MLKWILSKIRALHFLWVTLPAATKGMSTQDLRNLGITMAKANQFVGAIHILDPLLEIFPDDRELATYLGVAYGASANPEKGRRIIQSFFSNNPLSIAKSSHIDAATILAIFGANNTPFLLGRNSDGTTKTFRRGGHFTLRFLMNTEDYNFCKYYIAKDNIDPASTSHIAPNTPVSLLLNTIADPDVEMDALLALDQYIKSNPDLPVINRPSDVIKTSRDGNYKTFKNIDGFYFPRTERVSSKGTSINEKAKMIDDLEFTYPFILRQPGTHTARSTRKITDRQGLIAYLKAVQSDSYYIIEFVENKSDEGHYSKIRFFAIDGNLYPVVYHTDQVWNVHGGNRKTFMKSHAWMLEREQKFLDDPACIIGEGVYKRLQTLPDIIGLDFFGLDCMIRQDGTILIFELNPAMRHSFDHAKTFPYMHKHMMNITNAFSDMVNNRASDNT